MFVIIGADRNFLNSWAYDRRANHRVATFVERGPSGRVNPYSSNFFWSVGQDKQGVSDRGIRIISRNARLTLILVRRSGVLLFTQRRFNRIDSCNAYADCGGFRGFVVYMVRLGVPFSSEPRVTCGSLANPYYAGTSKDPGHIARNLWP